MPVVSIPFKVVIITPSGYTSVTTFADTSVLYLKNIILDTFFKPSITLNLNLDLPFCSATGVDGFVLFLSLGVNEPISISGSFLSLNNVFFLPKFSRTIKCSLLIILPNIYLNPNNKATPRLPPFLTVA